MGIMKHTEMRKVMRQQKSCKKYVYLLIVLALIMITGNQIYAKNNTNAGTIGERLDGDYAYISEAGMVEDQTTTSGTAMRTGTSPWDSTDEAGNDTTDKDNIVRSFDNLNYTVYFRSKMREDTPYSAYKTGTLHFEFVVPGTKNQIQYENDSMGWLSAKKDVTYDIKEEERDGKVCQVLTGSYLWEPNEDNPSAIGESYQELNIVLRALAMDNGQEIQPSYTFWLEHNQEEDYKTVKPQEVTVTAAPRYNVQLKTSDSRAKFIDTFDFNTGNDLAANKGAGSVYGRADVLGVTIQVMGKSAQHGLRGCEIPSGDITFDMTLGSEYVPTENGKTTDVSDSYTPLLWSVEGNEKNNEQYDGRNISGMYHFASGGAPFNKGTDYTGCKDGGIWTGWQEDKTVHIQIQNYQVDFSQLPYTDANVSKGNYTYYNPDTTKNYWQVQTACFSAGELWIVQPFYDQSGTYVVDRYGTGSFNTTVSDCNLKMTGKSGQQLAEKSDNSNQMLMTDDRRVLAMALELPGTIDQGINYQKYQQLSYGVALTDGCFENGKDWIIAGGNLNILEILKHNSAEGMNTGVAYDDLIKFDDTFFDLEKVNKGNSAGLDNMKETFLYGAKSDQSGWDHQEKATGEAGYDDEMMNATADDLIFFPSLEELKNAGYTCVAVLWEARGVASSQSTNCYIGLEGKVKSSAVPGGVYMVTHSARAWNKLNVQELVAENTGKEIAQLTDADYIAYMQSDKFPSRGSEERIFDYDTEYPKAFWINDTGNSNGLRTYQKSVYDTSGYKNGSAGVSYGDSCLVVDYATKIVKDTAQQIASGQGAKNSYDLDANQRIADYILKPSVIRTAGESATEGAKRYTSLYIEDTLPSGLSYISGSAFWGGIYTQKGEGKQGTVQGGTETEPEIIRHEDGTTTLRWYLDNILLEGEETYVDPIYYSCEIGTVGVEKTDVQNNEWLLNQAVIWGKDEPRREVNLTNGNLAEKNIVVTKNRAISLSKLADQPFVDIGQEMGFTLNIGNNADHPTGVIGVDSLPYQGDEVGSEFDGKCQVTELTVKNTDLLSEMKFYYTEDENLRGKASEDFNAQDFLDNSVWESLSVESNTGKVNIPDEFAPVAIAAVGTLKGQQTLKVHLNLYLKDAKAGDKVINRLTRDDMESDARTYVVSRALEGNVWIDADEDGLYQTSEKKIDGVSAILVQLKDGGDPENIDDYLPYRINGKDAMVETGQQMNLSDGTVTSYTTGKYKFDNLPAGTFGVVFTDGTFELYGYQATNVDQGEDDTIDSDAHPEYEVIQLKKAYILNIEMPVKEKMTSAFYQSKYHDLGIYISESIPDTGVSNDNLPPMVIAMVVLLIFGVTGMVVRHRKRTR